MMIPSLRRPSSDEIRRRERSMMRTVQILATTGAILTVLSTSTTAGVAATTNKSKMEANGAIFVEKSMIATQEAPCK